jgi:hypothetical protein
MAITEGKTALAQGGQGSGPSGQSTGSIKFRPY